MLRILLTLLVCLGASGQSLETKISKMEFGESNLDAVVSVLGEPRSFSSGARTCTRESLPERYVADYGDIAVSMVAGVAREIRIMTPEYRYKGGLHVGSPVSDIAKQLGEPRAVVSTGLPAGEPASGVLYESSPGRPGIYRRRDLGLALLLRDGKVAGIGLSRSTGATLRRLPRFDPNSQNPFQVDLRGADLTSLDLRDRATDLLHAVFDTRTRWPAPEMLPQGFAPERILETGRNPGLGVRQLHKRGITGKGVAIALVDNPILASHQEYGSRVRVHEYINASPLDDPDMHGSTVVSIAAGQTLGVAPEADLYLISCWAHAGGGLDLASRAKAFERVLEINRTLPAEKRIRVISMSLGWTPHDKGAAEMEAAAAKAKQEGLLVITSSVETTHGFRFHGLEREPLADPDVFESYSAVNWRPGALDAERLLVPMCSRTGAGPGSDNEYTFFRTGGWSWSIPYIAGVYALAAQVDSQITPDRFWKAALKTGRRMEVKRPGGSYRLGPIIDPVALMAELGRGR